LAERRLRLRVVRGPDAVAPVDLFDGALCGDAVFKGELLALASGVALWCGLLHQGQRDDQREADAGDETVKSEGAMVEIETCVQGDLLS